MRDSGPVRQAPFPRIGIMKISSALIAVLKSRLPLLVVLAGIGLGPHGGSIADAREDEPFRTTTHAGLQDVIKQNKGKVVLIDFWADFCVPCKKAFPQLVQTHGKFAKDGLVVLSVNLDDPSDK